MFERKIYQKMLYWKNELAPDYALFLKGARRTGKTTLAEKIGREEYRSYIRVSFDNTSEDIEDLFVNSLRDLDTLFNTLQFAYQTRLYPRESLIILDEIQLFPEARQAIKTLLEDGRFDYIETGSLASITKKSKDILIPSEEYTLEVLPMDFEEYLLAMQNDLIFPALKEHISTLKPMGKIHSYIMKAFREYMLVGGMPQAVTAYAESRDFGRVDFVKQQILSLYRQDMTDQEEENPEYVTNFFDRIPSELSKHDKRYILSHIEPNARVRDYKDPIKWLSEAMIINIANNVDDPGAVLNLSVIDPSFKCYMMDTGLLISLAYQDGSYLENELYKSILLDKLHVNEGMILENMTAQCLKANGHNAYYYKKTDLKTKRTEMEIDFLIRKKNKIIPIEVKSGGNRSTKSLNRFKEVFGKKVGMGIVFHHGEIKQEENTLWLPYYMAAVL